MDDIPEHLKRQVDDQVIRIRKRVRAKELVLKPTMPLAEVKSFEAEHGITLPDGYRRFVLAIGDGGDGPQFGGAVGDRSNRGWISSLLEPWRNWDDSRHNEEDRDYWTRLPDVARPFPLTEGWCWEDDSEVGWLERREAVAYGSLLIGDNGCGDDLRLIVTGPERGNVWTASSFGALPEKPGNFLDWYEAWLNRLEEEDDD